LTWGGALTYPLYLVHGQFGFFVIDQLHRDHSPYLVLAAAALLSLAIALLINLLVERPFARPLRRAMERSLAHRSLDAPQAPPATGSQPAEATASPSSRRSATAQTGR
jgi:peptidoglycan/LPS O-acetylase OafA/YrhL